MLGELAPGLTCKQAGADRAIEPTPVRFRPDETAIRGGTELAKTTLHPSEQAPITIPIKGMHCRACELRIEKRLLQVRGVQRVQVSHRRHSAEVLLAHKVSPGALRRAIAEAGYEVGHETRPWITRNASDYRDLLVALLLLVPVLLILRELSLGNIVPTSSSPSSLLVVLVVGLTAGVSTCMALVGGLVLGISARHAELHPGATARQKLEPHLYFGLGRIASYCTLGGLTGVVGSAFQLSTPVLGGLTILVGVVMLALGLQLTELFPRLSSGGLTLPPGLARVLGIQERGEGEYSHRNAFVVGALTFFLPCGFTQAMQLYAMSTGSFVSGALIMGVFALGTAPGLLGIGGLTSLVRGSAARRFFKFAGVLVIALAVFNISNGLNLTGIEVAAGPGSAAAAVERPGGSAAPSSASASSQGLAGAENGVQVVRMKVTGRGYSPNVFTVQQGIPVKWVITSDGSYSCANSLVSSKLGVRRVIGSGESVISFTPTEVGKIPFSCSMGMYRGVFNVVADQGAQP